MPAKFWREMLKKISKLREVSEKNMPGRLERISICPLLVERLTDAIDQVASK
jgi:hypothetical protein